MIDAIGGEYGAVSLSEPQPITEHGRCVWGRGRRYRRAFSGINFLSLSHRSIVLRAVVFHVKPGLSVQYREVAVSRETVDSRTTCM